MKKIKKLIKIIFKREEEEIVRNKINVVERRKRNFRFLIVQNKRLKNLSERFKIVNVLAKNILYSHL